MATVNKKFSVKNGLAVDGNVAVSNITSYTVDGPSSASLTFTLTNVTSATINGSNIATQGWVGDQGYLTSFSETDPVFTASEAYNITSTDTSNWDTAYGWGNHASAGYLTSFTETDPVFVASEAYNITSTDTSNWDTAYGWGNHASAGYLTSAVTSISSGDSNLVFSASSGSVTVNLAANVTVSQDLTVTGNLTVNGNTTTLNTETLTVEDNIIVLNKNVTGTPSLDAGVEVERGTYTNAKFYWNETANAWYLSTPDDSANAAVDAQIATLADIGTLADAAVISANSTSSNVYTWNAISYTTGKFLVQMKQGSDIHSLELLVAITGNTAYVTEYAELVSNIPLGETDVTVSANVATLVVTPAAGTVTTKIAATLIEA